MTDQYERGPGVDVVAGPDEVSDVDVTATTSDRWAVEGIAGDEGTSPPEPTSDTGSPNRSTVETVKDQSAQVGQQAADTGQHVASVAKDEAQAVVAEASDKARDLLGETKTQLRDQLSTQQSALATMLRSLADELHDMVEQSGSPWSSFAEGGEASSQDSASGLGGQAVREVSARASHVASWLEQRDPGDVVDEVTRFARRRPGLFLALAGGAGLVAGRFTRGLAGAGQDQSATSITSSTPGDAHAGNPSAGTRYPNGAAPAALDDTYPESTPTGVSARQGVSGADADSAWGTTHD